MGESALRIGQEKAKRSSMSTFKCECERRERQLCDSIFIGQQEKMATVGAVCQGLSYLGMR